MSRRRNQQKTDIQRSARRGQRNEALRAAMHRYSEDFKRAKATGGTLPRVQDYTETIVKQMRAGNGKWGN